jgi:hypothetical protein
MFSVSITSNIVNHGSVAKLFITFHFQYTLIKKARSYLRLEVIFAARTFSH